MGLTINMEEEIKEAQLLFDHLFNLRTLPQEEPCIWVVQRS